MKNKTIPVFPYIFIFLLFFTSVSYGSDPSNIDDLFNEGAVAYYGGNFILALDKWEQGLNIAQQHKNERLIGVFASNIGLAYADLGDKQNAFLFYEKALQVNKKSGDQKKAAINMNNIGVLYKNSGNFEDSLQYFKQALAVRQAEEDHRGSAKVLMNMCAVYSDSGDYRAAFKNIKEAIAIFEDIKDPRSHAIALINLGLVYTEIGQYDLALTTYDYAIAKNQSMKDANIQALIYEKIGSVHIHQKEYQKAVVFYQKALELERQNNNRQGIGDVLSNLGVAYKNLGDFDNALKHYEDALAIKRFLGDEPGEGAILGNIGLVQEKSGRYEDAYENLTQSRKIIMTYDLPEYRWRSLRAIGKVEARLAKYDEAIGHYQRAIDEIEMIRSGLAQKEMKASFMQDKMHVYDELIQLFVTLNKKDPSLGYDRKSFEVFERKQGRIFIEEVAKSGARNFSGIPKDIVDQERNLSAELTKLKEAIEKQRHKDPKNEDKVRTENLETNAFKVKKQLKTLRDMIKKTYPDYHALKNPRPVALKTLQASVLDSDEVMLVYNAMEEFTFLWMIGKDHFSIHQIDAGTDKLAKLVTAYRDNEINIFKGQTLRGARKSVSASGADTATPNPLQNLLFPEMVSKKINGYATVYIVPTGPLYLLPFEALKNKANQYLIENHSFAYLSSASLLNILRTGRERTAGKAQYPFLAFANPLYDVPSEIEDTIDEIQVRSFYNIMRGSIDALPETEDEVERIKNILKAPAASNPLRTRKNASRSVVLDLNAKGNLDDYRYISFACHGILPDDINGVTQPSLLLSTPDPVTNEIGLLTMSDVFGLKLNADLVALSACNTARGRIVRGEGVMGLTRAFMFAGTPALSVNLWSVETISAQKLSVDFFKALEQGKNRAQSLRESKLKLIRGEAGKQFQKPFFWAPMIIFGDGS